MTIEPSDHDALRGEVPLFAIGALDAVARARLDAHVRVCPACAEELAAYSPVLDRLAELVRGHDPTPTLRARILFDLGGTPNAGRVRL